MEVGVRYIVTKSSDDGTFAVGDHVSVNVDGSINCMEAQGWIDACDIEKASAGMVVEIDKQWMQHRKETIINELAELDVYALGNK